jgi:hypothetical protein
MNLGYLTSQKEKKKFANFIAANNNVASNSNIKSLKIPASYIFITQNLKLGEDELKTELIDT